ncbi:hypothetical protein Tco_1078943 [Tanacetum coccineum]|uniref:Uncharacterized protein n=1 Tax=Tanacetum coccineum TaxID=301880 RepID=A0ABQ5HSH3_9ASTR
MCLHALSRACHHTDGMTRFKWVAGGVEEFIIGIVRPQVRREVVPLGGVVVDEVLLDRVFSLPITTVKSIPHSCRMAFSHALAAALGKVAATPTSIEAWVKLLLLPRCTLRVFRPSNRQERRSGNRKSLQCHSIQRALASWGGDGFIELIPSLFAQPLRVVSGKDDRVSGSDSSTVGTNIKQCLRKVSDGHFTAAVKVLCSSGVAPFGTDTLTALLAKHPILPPPVMPGSLPSEPPLVVDVDNVLGCIQSFPKGTSCGRDGLRAQHILDALCGEGSAIAVGLLKAISVVVNLLLEGRCPKVLAEFVNPRPSRRCSNRTMGSGLLPWARFGGGWPLRGAPPGLELNIKKTEVFWPSCNGVKVKVGSLALEKGILFACGTNESSPKSSGPSIRAPLLLNALLWASQSCCFGLRTLPILMLRMFLRMLLWLRAQSWSLQGTYSSGCGIDGADSLI